MKRLVYSTTYRMTHEDHIEAFNENYSKNDPHRIVSKDGKVYFTDPYPITKLIKSYNKKYSDADLSLKVIPVDGDDGYSYGHFIIV